MRNIKRQGVLLGAGLLSISAVAGFSQATPAQARDYGRGNRSDVREEREDVKEARKEVRRERRDVKRAGTRAERREEREDLRDARQDLKRERQEFKHERRDNRQSGNNRYRNNNDWRYRQNGRNGNYRNDGGYQYGGGLRNDTPYYNEDVHGDLRTLEGTVTNDLRGNNFTMRLSNGQFLRVYSQIGEPVQLSQGDYVRVFGFSSNGTFYARGVRVLSNR